MPSNTREYAREWAARRKALGLRSQYQKPRKVVPASVCACGQPVPYRLAARYEYKCVACWRRYAAEWQRRERAKGDAAHIKKTRARAVVFGLKRRGVLTPEPCARCGAVKVHAHHLDYDKPLEIVWLCRRHHDAIHEGKE